jgi:predicted GNAT family N-acyltransferase
MIRIESVDVDSIRRLRAEILRPGLPLSESFYSEDDDPATLHLAALDDVGRVVGCSTWFPEAWRGGPAWRLRGMATDAAVRGSGVGRALLERGLEQALAAGVDFAWCNARTVALGFYRHHGFATVGEEFLTAHGIPHYVMCRPLNLVR